jgi:hypothetical protein
VALLPVGIAAWLGAKTTLAALGTAVVVSATTVATIEIAARLDDDSPATTLPDDRSTPRAAARRQAAEIEAPPPADEPIGEPEPVAGESVAAFDPAPDSDPAGRSPAPPRETRKRDDLRAESDLLERARSVLVSDPASTLVLTREHARRFPSGQLASERIVLEIEALYRAGRVTEARRRAVAVLDSAPDGLYSSRVRRLLQQMGE